MIFISYNHAEKKFPYLKDKSMTENERERLIGRLTIESQEMMDKFAIFVDRTREALEHKQVSVNDLTALIKYSSRNCLVKIFKRKRTIFDLFYALSDYCSFFDYEFIGLIIKRHCPELISELDKYEHEFKMFCRRRLCEIPSDIFKTRKGDKNNLYIKYDEKVDMMKLETAKQLEHRLSKLLETELCLLEVQEGCVELVFYSLCDLDENIPLHRWQEKQLTEMEVIQLKFGDYAFPSSDAKSPASDTGSDSGNETMSICTTSTNFTAYSDSTSLLSVTDPDSTSWADLSTLPKNITWTDLLVGNTEPQFV